MKLSRWLGVPYAQSIAGERRFAPPVPLNSSDECVAIDAVKPHPPCAHWVEGTGVVGNDDCLRINIWAPAETTPRAALRGLVLAATGHWFQRAANDVPQWEELAAQAGMVVMSPNVRLGVLGFLHPSVKGIANDVAEEDAMAAVLWALDNAAAFGADPSALMLVGNGTGGYLLAQATGGLKANVSRAVLEGSLHKSVVPWNTAKVEPSKELAAKLGCSVNKSDAWSTCFSNASLEALLSAAEQIDLRFTPAMDLDVIITGGKRKMPKINEVVAGADIAQARALLEEYVRPKAEASGNASTPEALFKFTIKYLTGDDPLVASLVEQQLKGGDEETKLVLLAQAVSGCATRSAARSASRGYHYVVDGGAQPLFEPVLSTAAVAQYLSEGKVPKLKSGEAWPPSEKGSRFLFSNGTEVIATAPICDLLESFG
ncbi:para-nitrobenzyl esterase-like [Amblyomma americanum]